MVKTTGSMSERPLPERFRLAAESSEEAVAIIEDGRLVCTNDRLCNLIGYSADELAGMSPLDLAAPEERERLSKILQQVQDEELPSKEVVFWALRKDGSRRYVRQRFEDYDSEMPSHFVVMSDLTTEELAQRELAIQEDFLQQILGVSQALKAADSPETMLNTIVQPAMDAGACAALLLVTEGDASAQPEWAEVAAVHGSANPPLGTRFYLSGSPQTGLLLSNPDRPTLIADLDTTAQGMREEISHMMGVGDVQALAILPLQADQQWQGLVMIAWPEPHEFGRRDKQLYGLAGACLASSLRGQRLFEETQRHLSELAMLLEVSQALAGAPLGREQITGTIIGQFLKMMGIPEASISLHDPETGLLNVMADLRVAREGARPVHELEVYRLADYPATRQVMKTLEPLVVQASDPNADPAELAFMQPRGIKTLIILPLAVKGQSIGIVELEATEREVQFTSQDLKLAMTLANQAAVALESTRLFEQAQAALAEVQATHRSYLRQAWQQHLHQRRILEQSGFLYDQQHADSPAVVIRDTLSRPEIELAIVEGRPCVVQDSVEGQERTGMAIPITVRGQTIGVIGVEMPTSGRQWTQDEIAIVQAVSDQLGQALEGARLFSDTRRSAERERLISEITAKIRSSADVQSILETTAAELGQVLGTSRALVRLVPGEPEPGSQHPLTRTQKASVHDRPPEVEEQR